MITTERAQTFVVVVALGLVCIGSAGVGIGLWSSGSGLSPDSVTYLDMAQNIAHGKGLTHKWAYWDPVYKTGRVPTATSLWPPGYPLAIAALVTLGVDPYFAGRLICLLSFTLLPLPIYGLARFFLPPARALLCTGVVMALYPTVVFASSVTAESPFLLLSTLSLLYTIRGLQAQTPREMTYCWLTASAGAGAAFLLRYVGVACVAGVVIAALLPVTKRNLRSRALHLAAAAGPAGLVVGAVFLRNWVVSGALVYSSHGGDLFWSTLGNSVRATVASIFGWKDLLGPRLSLLRPFELALLGGLIGLALLSFWQTSAAMRKHQLPLPGAVPSGVIGLFIVLGLAVAVRGCATVGVPLETRYVTIYLPWCFVLLLGWALRVGNPAIASRWVHLACILWLLCQLAVTALYVSSQEEGYIAAGSRSPTIAWVKMNVAPNETILTNRGPDLAYWCPNPVLGLPRPPFSAKGLAGWDAVDSLASKAHARYLVYSFGYPETPRWDAEEFRFLRSLDTPEKFPERNPISFSDGVVYQVGRAHSSDPNPK
ncbi:MAG: glycosyltransferase family 39 protein [Candidatus Rokubacteria bacterium]|nr:glycosyltransferase family 39 protein [Candidatus Rokubacteria bacterium]